jgi:hypothetical protein
MVSRALGRVGASECTIIDTYYCTLDNGELRWALHCALSYSYISFPCVHVTANCNFFHTPGIHLMLLWLHFPYLVCAMSSFFSADIVGVPKLDFLFV